MDSTTKFIASIIISYAAGFVGSIFTDPQIPLWYATLAKPQFTPPNWIFGPVWFVLYLLIGISLYLVWERGIKNKEDRMTMEMFIFQIFLNAMWSILFFGAQDIQLGLITILIILIMIGLIINRLWDKERTAAILLIPYMLWIAFATVLNFSILVLN